MMFLFVLVIEVFRVFEIFREPYAFTFPFYSPTLIKLKQVRFPVVTTPLPCGGGGGGSSPPFRFPTVLSRPSLPLRFSAS